METLARNDSSGKVVNKKGLAFNNFEAMITAMINSDNMFFISPAGMFDALATNGFWLGYYYFVDS